MKMRFPLFDLELCLLYCTANQYPTSSAPPLGLGTLATTIHGPLYYKGGGRGGGGPGYTSTPKIAKFRRKNDFSAGFSRQNKLKKLSAPYARP